MVCFGRLRAGLRDWFWVLVVVGLCWLYCGFPGFGGFAGCVICSGFRLFVVGLA